jgi:hypothetical protein
MSTNIYMWYNYSPFQCNNKKKTFIYNVELSETSTIDVQYVLTNEQLFNIIQSNMA